MTFALITLLIGLLAAAAFLNASVVRVPEDRIGIVTKRFGRMDPRDEGRTVRAHGSPGVQASTLSPGILYFRPASQYSITTVPRTQIPHGRFGLVVALAGVELDAGQSLGRHVDCRHFQDGLTFLREGGQQGPQAAVLPGGGSYEINPRLFRVLTGDEPDLHEYGLVPLHFRVISIAQGEVGVVVTRVGASSAEGEAGPPVPGHEHFQKPWVFLEGGGRRGVQSEVLTSGDYRINPWFARVVEVPTREIILEWSSQDDEHSNRLDSTLEPMRVNVGGFVFQAAMTQTLSIPEVAAAQLVARFGEGTDPVAQDPRSRDVVSEPVRRFVDRVLARKVEAYLQSKAADFTVSGGDGPNAFDFPTALGQVTQDVEFLVTQTLDENGITARTTTLSEFLCEDAQLDALRRAINVAAGQSDLLKVEVDNLALQQEKDMAAIRLEAEGRKAQYAGLAQLVDLIGRDAVASERLMREIAKMQGPQTILGGDLAALLPLFPMSVAQSVLRLNAGAKAETGAIGDGAEALKQLGAVTGRSSGHRADRPTDRTESIDVVGGWDEIDRTDDDVVEWVSLDEDGLRDLP